MECGVLGVGEASEARRPNCYPSSAYKLRSLAKQAPEVQIALTQATDVGRTNVLDPVTRRAGVLSRETQLGMQCSDHDLIECLDLYRP